MARGKSLERERYWREVFERQAQSGLSAARFCREHGVGLPSFNAWKQKLRQRDGSSPAGSPSVDQMRGGDSGLGRDWLPVRIAAEERAEAIRVVWPNGLSAEIPLGCEVARAQELLRLVDALARPQPGVAAC
jgi:transposase-like protein